MSEERVTLRDIYSALNRIEDKLEKRIEDLEKQVDTLKSFQNKALGILSVISVFAGVISNYLWERVVK